VKRITITIDEKIDEKIRDMQVKMISETRKSVSFSQVLNGLLKEALENLEYQTNKQYV